MARPYHVRQLRALGPRTVAAYSRVLRRAYGDAGGPFNGVPAVVLGWPEGEKSILRSALVRAQAERGDPDAGYELASQIPASHRVRRVKEEVPESFIKKIEKAAALCSARDEALVMVPLRIGLRSEEFLSLTRAQVERALETNSLTFVRKGARESTLPCGHVRPYLASLLSVPAARNRITGESIAAYRLRTRAGAAGPRWEVLGEVLAGPRATFATRYNLFNRLVKKLGARSGAPTLSPHQLRHAFATRMHRDGAPMGVVQAALGHASVTTTERYVHVGTEDVKKWVRK